MSVFRRSPLPRHDRPHPRRRRVTRSVVGALLIAGAGGALKASTVAAHPAPHGVSTVLQADATTVLPPLANDLRDTGVLSDRAAPLLPPRWATDLADGGLLPDRAAPVLPPRAGRSRPVAARPAPAAPRPASATPPAIVRSGPRWVRPAVAAVNSPYGQRWGRPHKGIDFAAAYGSPILAIGDGVVVGVGYQAEEGGYGQLTLVRHAGGVVSAYAHQSRMVVRVGDQVRTGQLLGYVGSTGHVTGPHLHFEIRSRLHGGQVNPRTWLRAHGVIV